MIFSKDVEVRLKIKRKLKNSWSPSREKYFCTSAYFTNPFKETRSETVVFHLIKINFCYQTRGETTKVIILKEKSCHDVVNVLQLFNRENISAHQLTPLVVN